MGDGSVVCVCDYDNHGPDDARGTAEQGDNNNNSFLSVADWKVVLD